MAEQEKLEQGKEEPRALTLEEKWQMDEEMQADGSSNYQVFTPQCRSCQFAKKGALEECRKYYTISWKILTVQEACPYYQSQEDQKQQSLELRGCQHALSVKNKISKSQIRVLAFFKRSVGSKALANGKIWNTSQSI